MNRNIYIFAEEKSFAHWPKKLWLERQSWNRWSWNTLCMSDPLRIDGEGSHHGNSAILG